MKIIVAGSREIQDENFVFSFLDQSFLKSLSKIECIISGMARGPDLIGKKWAEKNGLKVLEMPADWDSHGKKAGFLRNIEMSKIATHVIIFWDGVSRGSAHMRDIALQKGLWLKLVTLRAIV